MSPYILAITLLAQLLGFLPQADAAATDDLHNPIQHSGLSSSTTDVDSDLRNEFHREFLRYILRKGLATIPGTDSRHLDQALAGTDSRHIGQALAGTDSRHLDQMLAMEKAPNKASQRFGQTLNSGDNFDKRANLYGINRPLGMRPTRLADFGSMILPNKNTNRGRNAVIRYG